MLKKYGWVLQIISAALLLIVGVLFIINFDTYSDIVVMVTGLVFILYAVIRLWPLVKTTKSDVMKVVNIVTITLEVLVGILLVVMSDSEFIVSIYGYIIGVYLVERGVLPLFAFHHKDDTQTTTEFFIAILFVIAGSAVFTIEVLQDGPTILNAVLYIVIFSSGAGASYQGFGGYKGYRQYRLEKGINTSVSPSKQKDDSTVIEEPTEEPPRPVA
jgi:uncharacterized membrane protein HdeD (DUF308 family)